MFGLLAGAAASIIGGLIGSSGSSKATNTQVNNFGKGIALEQGAYDTIREDFNPFRQTGLSAMQQLMASLNVDTGAGFKESPGYQFALKEGVRAVDAGAANAGLIGSGARAKALQERGMGIANQEFNNYKKLAMEELFNKQNRLGELSRMGATATAAVSDTRMHTADKMAQYYGDIGAAKANNAKSQANIWGQEWSDATTGVNGFGDSPLGKIFALDW